MNNTKRAYAISGILFIVFSIIAFALPIKKNSIFFIACGFAILAMIYHIFMLKKLSSNQVDAKSRFYSFPIYKITGWYFISQLIVGLLEILSAKILPIWTAMIINVILAAIAFIGCIVSESVKEEMIRQEQKLEDRTKNMRQLQKESLYLASTYAKSEQHDLLKSIEEEFRYSDPVTKDMTKQLESTLIELMAQLRKALEDKNMQTGKEIGNQILNKLNERNLLR